MYPLDDTIAAIASPAGGAARGIIRLSGPNAVECLVGLFQPEDGRPEASRRFPSATPGRLRLPGLHSPLPCEVFLWCGPQPYGSHADNGAARPVQRVRSYTGQPVVEVHTLGSPPLLQMLLRSLCDAGARLAEPGEFTLRAFLAGRIDLGQAEAVLGVIDAAGPAELQVALTQLAGGLARPLHRLRNTLLDLLAHLEAGFDFADEELSFITLDTLQQRLADAEAQLAAVERQMASRNDVASAPRAVLAGRPNSGKSSLWNALVGESAALVSDRPGTTRDYLTAELDLNGVRCQLVDTAGIADAAQACRDADLTAQHAASRQRETAEIELLCVDSTCWPDDLPADQAPDDGRPRLIVLTKCDLTAAPDDAENTVRTSSKTGEGIAVLRAKLREKVIAAATTRTLAATAARCGESLRAAAQSLSRARAVAAAGQEELTAAELRIALNHLGRVTGAVYTDDVLDRVFSHFCVGK